MKKKPPLTLALVRAIESSLLHAISLGLANADAPLALTWARAEIAKRVRLDAPLLRGAVPMHLRCPYCRAHHVDEGAWRLKPHARHRCDACLRFWTPRAFATVGVPLEQHACGVDNGADLSRTHESVVCRSPEEHT